MQERLLLLKTQKNEIFKILLDEGLEPTDFSWSEVTSMTDYETIVPKLNFRDGQYYFRFEIAPEEREEPIACEFSPGETMTVESWFIESWIEQLKFVRNWARILKSETEAPDLWQEIEKYRTTFSLNPPVKLLNESIPAYETEQIIDALRLLALEIKRQFELTTQQNQFVSSKLEYLADAVKRQGRLDWVHTCIGVLITIAMGLGMAPAETSKLWQLTKDLLGKFIHLIGP